jgi:hypothetical protein
VVFGLTFFGALCVTGVVMTVREMQPRLRKLLRGWLDEIQQRAEIRRVLRDLRRRGVIR